MITYKDQEPQITKVFMDRKLSGKIIESKKGFRYFPLHSQTAGEIFPTLQGCKNSLESA